MGDRRVVMFRIQEEEYGIPIADAREFIPYYQKSRLYPVSADCMEGVVNLRGQTIPVVRLSAKFGLKGDKPDLRQVIVVKIGSQEIGIIVDEVTGAFNLAAADFIQSPGTCNEKVSWIRGVCRIGNRAIVLLNLARLFSAEELNSFERRAKLQYQALATQRVTVP